MTRLGSTYQDSHFTRCDKVKHELIKYCYWLLSERRLVLLNKLNQGAATKGQKKVLKRIGLLSFISNYQFNTYEMIIALKVFEMNRINMVNSIPM